MGSKEELNNIYPEINKTDLLKFTFGEKAKIEQKNNGEWLIESTLESRGFVPGGQKINLRLVDPIIVSGNLYSVRDMRIDDKKIELPTEVSFFPNKPVFNYSNNLNEEAKKRGVDVLIDFLGNEIMGGQIGARIMLSSGRIILSGFDSAEDLAILFHEFGHKINGNPYKIGLEDYESISKSISKLSPGENINEEDANTLLSIFKEEHEAYSNAIAMIKDLRKKGIDLFSKDPNFVYINLFFAISMSVFLKNPGNNNINVGKRINNPEQFLEFKS